MSGQKHDYNELIEEIERQHRRERLNNFWNRFAIWIIAFVAFTLLFTALYSWNESRQNSLKIYYSDIFEKGRGLLAEGQGKEGMKYLEEVAQDGTGQYKSMARFVMAQYYTKRRTHQKAYQQFQAIEQDKTADAFYRGIAELNILGMDVHKKEYDETLPKIDLLIQKYPEVRSLALELKGFVLYQKKEYQQARDVYMQVPQSDHLTKQRAQAMVRFITLMHLKEENKE